MKSNINHGQIIKIAGPLVVAQNIPNVSLYDVVYVGNEKLMGEVLELRNNLAWIQVYEDTAGLSTNQPVSSTNQPLSVTLGPGLMSRFYDGIQRPLESIADQSGAFISRGINTHPLDIKKLWSYKSLVKKGDSVAPGDIVGETKETDLITHKIMVPKGISGQITDVNRGKLKITDPVAKIKTVNGTVKITMTQAWPIRIPRPFDHKLIPGTPLYTGQRVVDTFFPILKGGTAATPGPFGSGKTVIQQQLAKWSDAQIIVYVGCGERGNEMTDVLKEFPELKDPHTGKPLMMRTVLIANTSNMPIAAREASIYTGITIAEYYRDMGYDVALMADSTSRWAEALREMSGRLEEMPGEEGYPAYLNSRIASFYERAGVVSCDTENSRHGSITVVGAVSPPGGDLSEPVSQASLRVAKVFWALDGSLAYARHYPAIHWLNSYSLYTDELDKANSQIQPDFPSHRKLAMDILLKESKLQEIIRIVGMDSISPQERIILNSARILREDYLQQNAFDDTDTYTSLQKQFAMLSCILEYHNELLKIVDANSTVSIEHLCNNPIQSSIAKFKYTPESKLSKIHKTTQDIPEILKDHLEDILQNLNDRPNIHESVSHAG